MSGTTNYRDVLSRLVDGGFVDEASEEMQKVVDAITTRAEQTRGTSSGEIKVTLKLKASANGVVEIVPEVAAKMPKIARAASIFWSDKDGALTHKNPKQVELPLRDVSGAVATKGRDIGADEPKARSV